MAPNPNRPRPPMKYLVFHKSCATSASCGCEQMQMSPLVEGETYTSAQTYRYLGFQGASVFYVVKHDVVLSMVNLVREMNLMQTIL